MLDRCNLAVALHRWIATLVLLSVAAANAAAAPQPMVAIDGGWFVRGNSTEGDADERPRRRVWIDAFAIDRMEVTREDYARCLAAGACGGSAVKQRRHDPHLPVVGVTWYDARDYCAWAGKRLPTEAEWERAARGERDRVYPWGDTMDCSRANFGNFEGAGPCAAVNPGKVVAVGGYPAGVAPGGAYDMAGNVWEWVEDWYGPYRRQRRRNPRGPRKGKQRVVRGGSCCSYFSLPRTTNRHRLAPGYAGDDLGFRCARSTPVGGGATRPDSRCEGDACSQ